MAVNLRVCIRTVCNRLCKHFKNFIDQDSAQADILKAQQFINLRMMLFYEQCVGGVLCGVWN